MKEALSNFKVYKSSAGSGKTTTLVKEYLRLSIPFPNNFKAIVGITFTIKATNEMKARVMETLKDIVGSSGNFGTISSMIYEEVFLSHGFSKEKFIRNSYSLLRNILHDYSNFAFSTIDSFVVKIVKSFAFDLKLPSDFDIELDNDVIIDEAVSSLISQVGYEKRLTNNLIKYIEYQADMEADTRIHFLVAALAKVLFNDSYSEFQKAMSEISLQELQYFADNIIKRRNICCDRIKDLGAQALELIHLRHIDYGDFYYGKSGGVPAYFNYLKNCRIDKLTPGKRLVQSIADGKWFGAKCPKDIQDDILSISEELSDIFEEVQPLIPEFLGLHFLRKNIEAILLLGEVNHEIQNYYQENSVIHLSETVKRVSEIVSKEQMPFIYERIGNKYEHFLIDEFQDTSVAQWNNLVPLLDNSLSSGNYNLVVGDAKQSIYSWRGGDFQQFINLPKLQNSANDPLLKEREDTLVRNFNQELLAKNYRSYKSVVKFNNNYFSFVKENENNIVKRVFEGHTQEFHQNKEGYVELHLVERISNDDDSQNMVVSIIRQLVKRRYSFGDITILSRNNKNLSYIADILLANEIPIISSNSLKVFSSIHIKFIVNFLHWIYDREDKISRTAILFYWKTQGILSEENHKEMEYSVTDDLLLEFVYGHQYSENSLFGTNDIPLLIEFLAYRFQILYKDYAFVIQLLNFAKSAEITEGHGYMNFFEYFDKYANKEFLSMPDDLNAVNLLTIHKSKGLEFPVVIWIDFAKGSKSGDYLSVDLTLIGVQRPQNMLIADNKLLVNSIFKEEKAKVDWLKIADEINVSYVATTRAKKELYIIAEEKSNHFYRLKAYAAQEKCFLFKEDENCYFLGVRAVEQPIIKKETPVEVLNNLNFIPWNHRISMRHSFTEGIHNIDVNNQQREGLKIHDLLSKLFIESDIKTLLDTEVALGLIRDNQREVYHEHLIKIINNNDVAPYFDGSWQVLNERSIISSEQDVFRPDRVLLKEGIVVVIDYKLSDYSLISKVQQDKYISQVKRYIKLLSQIYPDKLVSGKILWLKGKIYLQNID